MTEIVRSALVPYTAQQMFDLVDAVERYPEFLPWCGSTEIIQRDQLLTRATIGINFRGVRQRFSTENRKQPPVLMSMKLIEGPFKSMDGEWRFTELGADGCKVDLRLEYEFSTALLDKLIGPVFGYISGNLIDAFLRRAERVYGMSGK